jgi:hypothetical protein
LYEQDVRQLVMAAARALASANDAAIAHDTQPADCLVTISEQDFPAGRTWRIHYGPRDFVLRRGGDLIVLVEERTAAVRVIRGQ